MNCHHHKLYVLNSFSLAYVHRITPLFLSIHDLPAALGTYQSTHITCKANYTDDIIEQSFNNFSLISNFNVISIYDTQIALFLLKHVFKKGRDV